MAFVIILGISATLIFTQGKNNPVDEIAEELNKNITNAKDSEPATPALNETVAERLPETPFTISSTAEKETLTSWWADHYTKIAYHYPNLPKELDVDLPIKSITYTTFPVTESDTPGGALYIELTTTKEDPEPDTYPVEEWLRNNLTLPPDADEDATDELVLNETFLHGSPLVVLPKDATSRETLYPLFYTEDAEEMIPSPGGFTNNEDWEQVKLIENNVYWNDITGYYEYLTQNIPEDQLETISTVFKQTTGTQPETRFLGVSEDSGKSWEGLFISGGLDPEEIDLVAAEDTINSTVVIGDSSVIDEGLLSIGSIISSSNVVDEDGNVNDFGEVTSPYNSSEYVSAVVDKDNGFKSSIIIVPNAFEAFFMGSTYPSNIAYVTFDVTNKDSAKLTYEYYGAHAEEEKS